MIYKYNVKRLYSIGFAVLIGMRFWFIVMLGIILIAGNVVCETLMGFMNTADILDAVYGTIGTVAAFVYLFIEHKYGLILVNSENHNAK